MGSVHPDHDFECMGVLMEHTQDVKAVAWHPTEEVSRSLVFPPKSTSAQPLNRSPSADPRIRLLR